MTSQSIQRAFLLVVISIQLSYAVQFPTLRLIDRIGNNLLFRGGDPVSNGVFQYDTLVSEMNSISPLPSNFKIVSVNLLNPATTDKASISVEQSYWNAHPTRGYTILQTTNGAEYSPYSFDTPTIRQKALNISDWMDDLPSWIPYIRSLLANPSATPLVIFVHCTCGCDRTGEWAEAYYMMYQNKTLTQARNINVQIIDREQYLTNLYAAQWFCFYLKFARNYSLTCTFPDSDAIIIPKCMIEVTQSLSFSWIEDGITKSQFRVTIKNTDPVNTIPSVTLYPLGYSPVPTQYWGAVKQNSGVYTFGAVAPSANYSWIYIVNGHSPITFITAIPSICIDTPIVPTIDSRCYLSVSQSLTSTWDDNGVTYSQWEATFSNTKQSSQISDSIWNVTFSTDVTLSSFYNIDQVGPKSFTLASWANGIAPGAAYPFGYIKAGTSALSISFTSPSSCVAA